jgi:hypothetical protein
VHFANRGNGAAAYAAGWEVSLERVWQGPQPSLQLSEGTPEAAFWRGDSKEWLNLHYTRLGLPIASTSVRAGAKGEGAVGIPQGRSWFPAPGPQPTIRVRLGTVLPPPSREDRAL